MHIKQIGIDIGNNAFTWSGSARRAILCSGGSLRDRG